MDGRRSLLRLAAMGLLALVLAACGLWAGCSRRPADQPAASQPEEQPAAPVEDEQAVASADPWPASGGERPDAAFVEPPEAPAIPPATDAAAADSAVNPLRSDAPFQLQAAPPPDNPLRSLEAVPRMAFAPQASAFPESAAEMPLTAAPSFGEPPPAVSAEPLTISPRTTSPQTAAPPPIEPPASAMAMSAEPAIPATTTQPYRVVQVFYGTDRRGESRQVESWTARSVRFLPAGCCALVTLCLASAAASRKHAALWLLAVGGTAVSLGLGFQAAAKTIASIRAEGKEGLQYTSERSPGGNIDLGMCEVTIPLTHRIGEVESPSILRLEIREDVARHVVLRKTERLADERFYELLRERVQASPAREVFVFIHGFNVSFDDAARRTAQIHHDLEFAGAPIFFSWPANTQFVLTYPADETNVAWSAPHLKRFLLEVTKESGAESVNLIAHSMGNRALAAALREIELELRGEARLFNQVILAAPDLDADDFRYHIAPAMQRTARRLTLYASSRDDALLASHLVHRGPRAGDAGRGLVVVPGIDTIDVTAIDTSPWGHAYYGSSDPVLQDVRAIVSRALAPQERTWLSPAERDGLTYWIFQPVRTAGGTAPPR